MIFLGGLSLLPSSTADDFVPLPHLLSCNNKGGSDRECKSLSSYDSPVQLQSDPTQPDPRRATITTAGAVDLRRGDRMVVVHHIVLPSSNDGEGTPAIVVELTDGATVASVAQPPWL